MEILITILKYAMPFIIMGIVGLLKHYYPQLKPYLPIIAPIVGAVLPPLAVFLSGLLGIPVDFSPIIDILTGAVAGSVAVNFHQIGKQLNKRPIPFPTIEMRDGKVKRGL